METTKPPVWQMIKEAINELGSAASYSQIKSYIKNKWTEEKDSTISAQIIVLTVNHLSRVHYPENNKPRFTNTGNQYDVLFSVARGEVVKYDENTHGVYEIYRNEFDSLKVRRVDITDFEEENEEIEILTIGTEKSFLFPLESYLRDFLIKNLDTIKEHKLQLYVDETDRIGREYRTEVGFIDILTVDENGNFIVFELKLERGPDKAIGQLLRYMGWVKENIAKDKDVRGIIVANKMDLKIKYAVKMTPNISLFEYEMNFSVKKIS